MKQYLHHDAWRIIEKGLKPEYNKISESVFSLGNGKMGQRANFEEAYSGPTLPGNYMAGVYYPDKTRVGWWKNGYPEYFAKVLNAANWIGIGVAFNGETLDLAQVAELADFERILDMKTGLLHRSFIATLHNGAKLAVRTTRFNSIADDELGAIEYTIEVLDGAGSLTLTPFIDFDVKNEDANYDEKFWAEVSRTQAAPAGHVIARTLKTDFHVASGMQWTLTVNGQSASPAVTAHDREKYIEQVLTLEVKAGDVITLHKYVANVSSMYYDKAALGEACTAGVARAVAAGFETLKSAQAAAWAAKWEESDITIEGDVAAQQGIRFNIFQLNQTYTGEDERLNIGPKGFTGEKYGGSTYWDTEAYCLPFYLSTADQKVARQLLVYRYKQLDKAIENAQKLGFTDGAALYPMVTMNGEECHNEWEITFEEIHRNGAIAYAIFDYVRYTDDKAYLVEYGAEVLLAIARFWAQRVNFSEERGKYVMLGVTGPNEYENNVNNNWYTNYIATWCLEYAAEALQYVKTTDAGAFAELAQRTAFDADKELAHWSDIRERMYFPRSERLNLYLQQDNYLDKDLTPVADLDPKHLPLVKKWSWDRILRSCYIKQADTLQGMYFFEERFTEDEIRRHFAFYEPRTVHESSLSPCVHSILAAKLGMQDKAYEMYLRTARLDLDDYNSDSDEGCHITSMAGTWMAVVKGFGGLRVQDGQLSLAPFLPQQWTGYDFKVRFRGNLLKVVVKSSGTTIENHSDAPITLLLHGAPVTIEAHNAHAVA